MTGRSGRVERVSVSSGDVVEVKHDEDRDDDPDGDWGNDEVSILGEGLVALLLADTIGAFDWEHTSDNEDTDEDVEGGVDEELNSHPLDKRFGGLRSVLLEPLEPLP